MKEINYWQQFLNTGKVDDYLQYRASTNETDVQGGSALSRKSASFAGSFRENAKDSGRDGAGYAGLRGSDRDRDQGRADWRI